MRKMTRIFSLVVVSAVLIFGFGSSSVQAAGSSDAQVCVQAVARGSFTAAKGAQDVKIAEVKLTNICNRDVVVSGAGFLGNFGDASIKNPILSVNGTAVGKPNQTKSYGIDYNALSVKLAHGSTADLVLQGDVSKNVTAKALGYRFNSCPHVFIVKDASTGSKVKFSVDGKSLLTIAKDAAVKPAVSSLKAEVLANNAKVEKGGKDVKLMEVKLTNTGTEDLTISSMGFMGDFGSSRADNTKLYIDGASAGSPNKIKNYEVIYNSLGLRIASGKSATLVLRGDISKDIKSRGLGFRLDSCPNVFVAKGTNGTKAKIAISGKSYIYFK